MEDFLTKALAGFLSVFGLLTYSIWYYVIDRKHKKEMASLQAEIDRLIKENAALRSENNQIMQRFVGSR